MSPCANCGAEVAERYCSRCGQDRGLTPHVPLSEFAGEALGEALSLDSRMGRTLGPFFLRPGFLTTEYLAGRRVRYSSPLRLYLLSTVLFFLLAAAGDLGGSGVRVEGGAGIRISLDDGEEGVTGPSGMVVVGARSPEERARVDRALAEFRTRGSLAGAVADRIEVLRQLPPEEASRRLTQSLLQQAPRVLFFLVPVMAGLLALLYRRSGLFYAEHVVFALHAHALGFAALLPGQVFAHPAVTLVGAAFAGLHLLVGMHRVYRRPWPGTLARFLVLAFLYLLALGIGLAVATLLALALM